MPYTCDWCHESADAPWLILHQPGCPAGEEMDNDEDLDEVEEDEVT